MKNTYTIIELINLMDTERENLLTRKMDKSNRSNALKKCDIVENMLWQFDENLEVANIEGCWKDGEIRSNQFVNVGSVVEALVRYLMGKSCEKTNGIKDCGRYEVKASLTSKSLCTPTQDNCTLVVNGLGVWKCYKKDINKYAIDKKKGDKIVKVFPHNAPCGEYMQELSVALGL